MRAAGVPAVRTVHRLSGTQYPPSPNPPPPPAERFVLGLTGIAYLRMAIRNRPRKSVPRAKPKNGSQTATRREGMPSSAGRFPGRATADCGPETPGHSATSTFPLFCAVPEKISPPKSTPLSNECQSIPRKGSEVTTVSNVRPITRRAAPYPHPTGPLPKRGECRLQRNINRMRHRLSEIFLKFVFGAAEDCSETY